MTQQEEIKKQAKAIGKRLALMLTAANLPDEVKAGFAAMIPQMNPQQLDRLMKILEANVSDTAVSEASGLVDAVKNAQAQYDQKRTAAEEKAVTELDEIESVLKQAQN